MPDALLEILIKDIRDSAAHRLIVDIEDIEETLNELSNFMFDVRAAQALDSIVDFSQLSNTKERCTTNPTVICYLSSIFNQLNVDTLALNVIPDKIGNSLLSPEIVSTLWSNVDSEGLKFDDCLKSFFEALLDPCLCGILQ